MQGWVIVIVALAYVTLLFAIASVGDRRAAAMRGRARPLIYAASLAIYCTSWTFFGSVGLASSGSFEFLAIYIGPILVFMFCYPLLRRITRLAKSERITSIADFLAARYGKSFAVASIATLIATIGVVPYIALQLKAISGSVSLMVEHYNGAAPSFDFFFGDISLSVALLLAIFASLFGTRHADATEHQDGLILAVAVESAVKLVAFLAIGIAVVFVIYGTPAEFLSKLRDSADVVRAMETVTPLSSWIVLTCLSACAIIMLPRQFYVTVVENRHEGELRTASWLFPLYLVAINLFVIPIAFAGLAFVGDRTNSDLYVLAVPLLNGNDALAMAAFIGGLSAATAMVIVETVALSIMISNDLVIPIFLRKLLKPNTARGEDWSALILNVRRAAIVFVLFAAFLYYRETTDNTRLAAIGLISFAAIAQFAPPFFGGLIWRGGNARGAILGMAAGFTTWAYTLLFPSLAPTDNAVIVSGLLGLEALRPQSLFGVEAEPLTHGVMWSLGMNALFFVLGSLSRLSEPLERIQASIFVPREVGPIPSLRRFRTAVTVNDLRETISRYLGVERTERSFQSFEEREGRKLSTNEPADTATVRFSEQLLASAVGSSSARLILSLLFQRHDRSSRNAYRLLDDASEALQHNRDLLQIALDQMEQGITVFDKDFRLTCWNRQFRVLFGLPDEMGQVGVPLTQILAYLAENDEIDHRVSEDTLDRMIEFGKAWQIELKASRRVIELRSNPMPDGGIVATYADVTARMKADLAMKQLNETLEQRVARRTAELTRVNEELAQAQMLAEEANLGKTRFLAAAGHDILQPLNAARLYCSTLIETANGSGDGMTGPTAEQAANIESSLESVENILGAVLDISRLDTGALKPQPRVFRLDGLLRQIANDFLPLAREKGLDLRLVPSSVAVETDRNLLRRLVQNLVSNAVKYTRTGRVLIGARRRGEMVEIQVWDTGIGISDSELNSVFREFTRLDDGMREAQGLGLGLSIVDRIARVLRLEIQLQSRKDSGTRFSVILPVTDATEPALAVAQPATSQPSWSLEGLSVLCIDNDERILGGMKSLLETWGCRYAAATGTKDIQQMPLPGQTVPDVIIADYHLDGNTGFDAIALARNRFGAEKPAILLTADRSAEVRAIAEASDIPVLHKPVRPAALRAALSRYHSMPAAAE
ncbi:MAG: hybrid sensor histidine kinase/response regulator [Rhizobiaceae bacterium]|nr:hybrid sensor histidine kinase/response regulator [Rhizobiaceae bacterium]MCV0405917.1 hybrid sensor histidine kinase/response regulator [Rhizobiaceae bacterium]